MDKTITISAITVVAVIMGMGAIVPAILPYAEAHEGRTQLPEQVCRALGDIEVRNDAIIHLLREHCGGSEPGPGK